MAMRTVPPPKSRKSVGGKLVSRKPGSGDAGQKRDAERFTRMLTVDSVLDTGLDIDVHASKAECAALADACGLVSVHDFTASFHVQKQDGTRIKVTGRLSARVTQTCVVSLDPFETLVHADIEVDFAHLDQVSGAAGTAFHGGDDPPDPIINGKIDLGALAEEFLILNLDLHPRKPGVVFEGLDGAPEPMDENSPFTVLRHRS